ncbi:hypothetical protein [Burkholderia sp. Leaf177]|uniref:hypothetical protein n=1 Tax=Burkholderia sp. Leaf177 TaxID=1736287 RepID=UPI000AB2E10B|nr:hypothetical protein [Burkholderia sp. Leaf177]
MKKVLLLVSLVIASAPAFAQLYNNQRAQPSGSGMYGNDQQVNGYSRSNGTYVEPYHRTEADSNPYNNYSSQGNVNPYTGQVGHKSPGY